MINNGTIIGRLTKELETRTIKAESGDFLMGNGSIAVDKAGPKEKGEVQAGFFDFELSGKAAEIFAKYTSKGSLVALSYELIQNRWTGDDGSNKSRLILKVRDFQFLDGKKEDNSSESNKSAAKSKTSSNDEYDPFAN